MNANNIEFDFCDNGKIVNYKFTYNKKSYNISCSKKAAASQLYTVTHDTYYKNQIDSLRGKYELTNEEISKYFLAGMSYNNNVSMYFIYPECGCKTWNEVVNAIKAEKETPVASRPAVSLESEETEDTKVTHELQIKVEAPTPVSKQ